MSETCGQEHPEHPERTCDKPVHPFGWHMHRASGTVWEGLPVPERTKKGTSRVDGVKDRAKPQDRVGAPTSGEQRRDEGMTQVLAKTEQEYKAAFRRRYLDLVASREPFTSEDVTAVVGMPQGHPNAVGALFSALVGADQRLGRIEYVAHIKAQRANQNATRIAQYRAR